MNTPTLAPKLIIGLGNPGAKYHATRHNAGFWLLERLAEKNRLTFSAKSKFFADVATAPAGIYLLKPQTFMNLSGKTAVAAMQFYRAQAAEILVAHDEVDLAAGVIKLKHGGGDAGHRGLADISQHIGSDYWRLRIGVGKPERGGVEDYVLRPPTAAEQEKIDTAIGRALSLQDELLAGDYNTAMQTLHSDNRDS